jgi:hypothetical protein
MRRRADRTSIPTRHDAIDLRIAAEELEAGTAMLAAAQAARDPVAVREAVAKLALASRAIDLVVDRRG